MNKEEVYWLRLWIAWLKSNIIKRFIFRKAIISLEKSLKRIEIDDDITESLENLTKKI